MWHKNRHYGNGRSVRKLTSHDISQISQLAGHMDFESKVPEFPPIQVGESLFKEASPFVELSDKDKMPGLQMDRPKSPLRVEYRLQQLSSRILKL